MSTNDQIKVLVLVFGISIIMIVTILMEKKRKIILGICAVLSVLFLCINRQWQLFLVAAVGGFLLGSIGIGICSYQWRNALDSMGSAKNVGIYMAVMMTFFFMLWSVLFPAMQFKLF